MKKSLLFCSVALGLSACQTTNTTSNIDSCQVVSIASTLLTAVLVGKNSSAENAVLAGAGALAATQFFCYLSAEEREAVERELASSLETSAVTGTQGQTSRVETEKGYIEIEPVSVEKETKSKALTRLANVQKPPKLIAVNKHQWVVKNVNLRSGPGTDTPVIRTLRAGEKVTVLGRAYGSPWLLIADQAGNASGYVHGDYVSINAPENMPNPTSPPPASAVEMAKDRTVVEEQVPVIVSCQTGVMTKKSVNVMGVTVQDEQPVQYKSCITEEGLVVLKS